MAKNHLIVGVIVFVCGVALAGIGGYFLADSRSAGEIAFLTERYNKLSRDYTERQRELESNLTECIGYVESARTVVERTSENASRAITNLRAASDYIRQGIEERKNLEMELSRIRAGLYRIRDMGGPEIEQVEE